MKKTAVIVKGNPKLIDGNTKADVFYNELKIFLESLGFEVSFDVGEPFTQPQNADVWIGHSRGADRLRFALPAIITIGIGVPESEEQNNFHVVNHPDDKMTKRKFDSGEIIEGDKNITDDNHYLLTEEMKNEIKNIIKNAASLVDPTTFV